MFRRKRGMGRLAPRRVISVATHEVLSEHHYCDRCGYSHADGKPISVARFAINTANGAIHLCGHHFLIHRFHIHERAYETTEL
jgi:hypothetical protein